jgi:hypothetical protein
MDAPEGVYNSICKSFEFCVFHMIEFIANSPLKLLQRSVYSGRNFDPKKRC